MPAVPAAARRSRKAAGLGERQLSPGQHAGWVPIMVMSITCGNPCLVPLLILTEAFFYRVVITPWHPPGRRALLTGEHPQSSAAAGHRGPQRASTRPAPAVRDRGQNAVRGLGTLGARAPGHRAPRL